MKQIEAFLDKFLSPIATWMSNNKFFSALSEAFMRTTPVTLGAAVLMIIGNFPIPSWITFLATSGLKVHFDAVLGASMNALSLFIAFNFAYVYARNANKNPLTAGSLAVASFLILIPQAITDAKDKIVVGADGVPKAVFDQTWTGGMGLLVAIMVGFAVAKLYIYLTDKNIVVKLPDSVPSNVSESLSPSILSGIIFIIFFLIRLAFSYTPFQNVFFFVFGLIQAPLQNVVASPTAIILIFTLANVFWFFGIHPNMVYGAIAPILMANATANMNAFKNGEPLPYFLMGVVAIVCGNAFGGQGSTYGLVISMFTAKSQRYKQLLKLAGPPSIFNINEPLIFGTPLMMNPIFFFPMVLSPVLMGVSALIMTKILNFTTMNPMIQLPWTTPAPITMGLSGGWKFLVIFVVALIINVALWFPFFKVADNREYALEQAAAADEKAAA